MSPRNYQLEHLIKEAMDRVAERGKEADMPDLMLAGFGYLSHEIQRPQWWSIKRVVPVAFAGGIAFGSGIFSVILKWTGIGGG